MWWFVADLYENNESREVAGKEMNPKLKRIWTSVSIILGRTHREKRKHNHVTGHDLMALQSF